MPKQCIKCARPNYGGGDQCGRCLDSAVEKYFGLKEGIVEEHFGDCKVGGGECDCYLCPQCGDPGCKDSTGCRCVITTEENWGNEGGAN